MEVKLKTSLNISAFQPDQIEVLVHPQSMIHALCGVTTAHLMATYRPPRHAARHRFALHHPTAHIAVERLDLAKIGSFEIPCADDVRWPALRLARNEWLRAGWAGGGVQCAAKECAGWFVRSKLRFRKWRPNRRRHNGNPFPSNGDRRGHPSLVISGPMTICKTGPRGPQ